MGAAEAEDYQIRMGDLLEKEKTESVLFEQYYIKAVPFVEGYSTDVVSLTSEVLSEAAADSLSCSKIFLVSTLDTETDTTDLMVVTMIPDGIYLSEHEVSEITYLDKSEYSGIILYSDLDGSYRESNYFENGRIFGAEITTADTPCPEDLDSHYLAVYQVIGTKATNGRGLLKKLLVKILDGGSGSGSSSNEYYGGELDYSSCTAAAPSVASQTQSPPSTSIGVKRTTSGGGGSSCAGTSSSSLSPARSEKQQYTVTLYASRIGETECGMVSGSGTYSAGAMVTCSASPLSGYRFQRWSGNIPTPTHSFVTFSIRDRITATALFCSSLAEPEPLPCWNATKNIANPLSGMRLAPTKSGNLNRAVFGLNMPGRTSGTHGGIDLAAEVGTPIYAPCDGTIATNMRYVVNQPEGDPDMFPQGIDKNNAGNRFSLQCVLSSGEKVTFSFFHLQAGTPVAINPRSGIPFVPGDKVYQGEIIGYVGRTGNAWNKNEVPNPHLHLVAFNSNGVKVDSEPYLNGNVQRSNGKVIAAEIIHIICNDKDLITSNSYYTDASGKYY